MRVLVHMHTMNDMDVIRGSVAAVMAQTRPVDGLLIVDNASSDGTPDVAFPPITMTIRNRVNLGTSGAVAQGLAYGLENGFDWVWTLDADSAPHPDALQILLEFHASLSPEAQRRTAWVASLPVNQHDGKPRHGLNFVPGHVVEAPREPGAQWYACDCTIWSGTLFRIAAVREIGLPSSDYVLDFGEAEYGYRCQQAGYGSYIHLSSIIDHDIGGTPSSAFLSRKFGPLRIPNLNVPPIRAYYIVRNNLYFWLHQYRGPRRLYVALLRLYKAAKLIANALLIPEGKLRMLVACLRGYRDGVLGHIQNRYR